MPGTPWCFLDRTQVGYQLRHPKSKQTESGFENQLQLKPNSYRSTPFEQLYHLNFSVTYVTDRIVRFRIEDANKKRYEVPVLGNFNHHQPKTQDTKYEVTLEADFNLTITRKEGGIKL